MSSREQAIISGWDSDDPETTENRYTKPQTLRYCHHCEEEILRSRFGPHQEHDWVAQMSIDDIRTPGGCNVIQSERDDCPCDHTTRDSGTTSSIFDDEGEEEEDLKVGGKYSIRLSYSVDYSFNIIARSENEALRQAKDEVRWGNAVDAHSVHKEISETKEIFESDEDLVEEYDLGL